MTWTKLSDDFADDCWSLSDAAFRTHVEGLLYSNRRLFDLRLPTDEVRRFAKNPEAVAELVREGYWAEDGENFVIRHHGAYQRTREAVINQQIANSKNGKKGGRRPQHSSSERANGGRHDPVDDVGSSTDPFGERGGAGQGWRGQNQEVEQDCDCFGPDWPHHPESEPACASRPRE